MSAHKRTPIQIERDRKEITAMYLRGDEQCEIRDWLAANRPYSLSQQMISYDLRQIRKAWLASTLVDFNQMRANELAKVDNLEIEYWEAWARSCLDAETVKKESVELESADEENEDEANEEANEDESVVAFKVTRTAKGQSGDPRFLVGIQWCIERRVKLFGLDEPQEIAIYDWRREAQSQGLDTSAIFQTYVDAAYETIKESTERA